MKTHIRRWVNEKHNVTTAQEMKEALESHGGLKECHAAVVEVDTSKEVNKDSKIPGVSIVNNFHFEDTGIRVWKAYNVGPGRLIPYVDLQTTSQGDTSLKIIQPFGPSIKERGTLGESVRNQDDIFPCRESGCILTFRSQSEADKHMDTGKHRRELESESMFDKIRQQWASRVTGVAFDIQSTSRSTTSAEQSSGFREICDVRQPGWALRVTKKPSRMTEKAKEYLLGKFNEGARSGHKADPVQLAKEMKVVRDEEGHLVFTPEEWRSSQQISSLFSRLTAVQRQRGIREEDVTEEDVVAIQSEDAHETLRSIVINEMATPDQNADQTKMQNRAPV